MREHEQALHPCPHAHDRAHGRARTHRHCDLLLSQTEPLSPARVRACVRARVCAHKCAGWCMCVHGDLCRSGLCIQRHACGHEHRHEHRHAHRHADEHVCRHVYRCIDMRFATFAALECAAQDPPPYPFAHLGRYRSCGHNPWLHISHGILVMAY